MRFLSLALLFLPFCLSAPQGSQQQLIDLAAAGNGVIQLDDAKFSLLTSSSRNWSVAVQFTALDERRRCSPCRLVVLIYMQYRFKRR